MIHTPDNQTLWRIRLRPKDLGVAMIFGLALLLGWLLMRSVEGQTQAFSEPDGISLRYPVIWIGASSLQDVLLKVENPLSAAAFKTNLTIERRDLDPANPPTLQDLLDRRVQERGDALTSYQLIGEEELEVAGRRAVRVDYAYTVQPIDTPRRVALPEVVVAREYIIIAGDRSYYLAFAAPEAEAERVAAQSDVVIASVQFAP